MNRRRSDCHCLIIYRCYRRFGPTRSLGCSHRMSSRKDLSKSCRGSRWDSIRYGNNSYTVVNVVRRRWMSRWVLFVFSTSSEGSSQFDNNSRLRELTGIQKSNCERGWSNNPLSVRFLKDRLLNIPLRSLGRTINNLVTPSFVKNLLTKPSRYRYYK